MENLANYGEEVEVSIEPAIVKQFGDTTGDKLPHCAVFEGKVGSVKGLFMVMGDNILCLSQLGRVWVRTYPITVDRYIRITKIKGKEI